MRRVLVAADLHSGHRAGLTPPKWQGNPMLEKWADLRALLWYEFAKKIDSLRPFDTAIWNGDLIDGRGSRSGSTELITADRLEQTDIATAVIEFVGAEHNIITRGTPYHVGDNGEDYENIIAKNVKADSITDQEWPSIEGVVFDCKHTIGNTAIPHGKGTPILKEKLWNLIHYEFYESQPKADIFIRSHVHYFFHVEDGLSHGFITPALQGLGSKYGSRICKGLVHFGFIWFDITTRQDWLENPQWNKWLLTGSTQRKEALIL